MADDTLWSRPVPVLGDTSSARERAGAPDGWAMPAGVREALAEVVRARRDIRRFRPDPVPEELVRTIVEAGHRGPSVGHSQPWRFIVVRDASLRDRAAAMADRARLAQSQQLGPDRARQLLDLKLEGLREAPVGLVVACDRRAPAAGVLGRATFPDADLWSCAAAIENMWLTARAEGLGMGWVTLFEPDELRGLLGLPEGVETLGWLCLGWPDERPPSPGLERLAWSKRLPLDEVLLRDGWPTADLPRPVHHLSAPDQERVVRATDRADELLTTPDSLGVLDRVLDRMGAVRPDGVAGGVLVLAASDHAVTRHRVSSFEKSVGRDVVAANAAGTGMGAVAASGAGLRTLVVDAGLDTPVEGVRRVEPGERGDLLGTDGLTVREVGSLLAAGRAIGAEAARDGLVALGEVGIGNTTVAAAMAAGLLGLEAEQSIGLGTAADAAMVESKTAVVRACLQRLDGDRDPERVLATCGGGELALLAGVVLGAAAAGAVVVLDGLATSVAALAAVRLEPAVQGYLVAGQRSRERAHAAVLVELGLEPLLDVRLRSGEGVGACLAASLMLQGQRMRRLVARTR